LSAPLQISHAPGNRILSLDVFRGATIAAMILVNNPGSWEHIYPPLEHAEWHGWTFTDLVFPFFLWIVGVAITLSFAKRVERGDDRTRLFAHVVRRSVLIYGIGLFLNLFPYFRFATVRIPGVLPRIAVCYLIAATIFLFTQLRGRIIWICSLLTGYWLLMKFYPVPGYGAGILDVQGNFAQYVDGLFLSGHMWSQSKTWDPEGIVSTLPAIATTLFGILTGQFLQSKRAMEDKAAWMFFSGNCLLFAGLMLSTWMPINKKLWTTSFSVFMAGMALVVFASCYWIIDVKKRNRWSRPFAIYGMNAIAVYVLAGLLARLLGIVKVLNAQGARISLQSAVYENLFAPLASPINASLLYAIANVIFFYAVAYLMYRKKWFVRL
jgi:predicted acyltransferase